MGDDRIDGQRRDAGRVAESEQVERGLGLGRGGTGEQVGALAHQAEDEREQRVLDGHTRAADLHIARRGRPGQVQTL